MAVPSRQPPPAAPSELVVGIDLGTTFSVVAVWDWQHSRVDILPNDHGKKTTPSIVSYGVEDFFIGDSARPKMVANPENTVYQAKRLIGRTYDDVVEEFGSENPFPFKIVQSQSAETPGKLKISIQFRGEPCEVAPEEISGLVLFKLKEMAEKKLGQTIKKAVITVPAYFTEPQKRATRQAGELAGLEVLGLLPEPTAAALSYGIDRRSMTQEKKDKMAIDGWYILVFDLGGGTFDVSVLRMDGKGSFVVKAVTGDFHLGGLDFDQMLVDHFSQLIATDFPNVKMTEKNTAKLRVRCEEVKRNLSVSNDMILDLDLSGEEIAYEITRTQFENLCKPLFEAIMSEVESALDLAKLKARDIDDVVLVGGSSRIPYIQQLLRGIFPKKPICTSINPDEAIAVGAAVQAAALHRNQLRASSTPAGPPNPGQPEQANRAEAPPQAGPPPIEQGVDSGLQKINNGPDVVPPTAPPRNVPGGIPGDLQGTGGPNLNIDRLMVTNVTPLTLGIALSDGMMDILIPRGTTIPATKKDLYTTSNQSQRNVIIFIYEGEKPNAKDNHLLGKFALDVPTVKELNGRWPEIEVTFTVNGEGLFTVAAEDLGTKQKTSINIERPK